MKIAATPWSAKVNENEIFTADLKCEANQYECSSLNIIDCHSIYHYCVVRVVPNTDAKRISECLRMKVLQFGRKCQSDACRCFFKNSISLESI